MKARTPGRGNGILAPLYIPKPKTRKKKISSVRFLEIGIIFLMVIFIVLLGISIIPVEERPSSGILYTLGASMGISMNESSPSDYVKENQIEVYEDRIVIWVPEATLSRYMPTGSMLPGINSFANGIEVTVNDVSELNVGDIIAFQPTIENNELTVHRIIEIGEDNEGWYCITKGDNASQSDGKIREWQIKFKTIAIIY